MQKSAKYKVNNQDGWDKGQYNLGKFIYQNKENNMINWYAGWRIGA